jgi:hypothetical protein
MLDGMRVTSERMGGMSKRLGLQAVYVVVLWTGILLVGFHI